MAEFRSKTVDPADPVSNAEPEYDEVEAMYGGGYLGDLENFPEHVASFFEHRAAEASGQVEMDRE